MGQGRKTVSYWKRKLKPFIIIIGRHQTFRPPYVVIIFTVNFRPHF